MWGYAEEKFNLSAGELNRNNVESVLLANGVGEELSTKFIGIIDACELERYSQSSMSNDMNTIFEDAMNTITQIEDSLKDSKKKSNKLILVLMFLVLTALPASAITKENADNEYKKGNYQQAIKDYNELLKTTKSADLYYNLGNAYYRTDNITFAILSYERALLLSPSDDDIKLNLQIAQSKTIDKITPEAEMFLVQWYKSLVNLMGIDSWATLSIFSLVLTLAFFTLYLLSVKVTRRKVGFFAGMFFTVLFVLSQICAYQQKSQYQNRRGAIVVVPSLQLKDVPDDKGKSVTVIHEGTRVDIIDDSMKDWKHVKLGDNREGWLHSSHIQKI